MDTSRKSRGGSGELLADESFGIQLDSADPGPLAEALTKALTDEDWRRTAAEKTAARLEAHFTWDAVCQKLLALAQSAQN